MKLMKKIKEDISYPEECNKFLNHKYQIKFLRSNKKFRACISGRRGGKTFVGVYQMVLYLLQYPGIIGCIASPKITQMMKPQGPYEQFFEILSWWSEYISVRHNDKKNNIVTLDNGSRCVFVHCGDFDRLRGMETSVIYLDEAAYIKPQAYDILLPTMTQVGNYPKKLWLCTTPYGRNWVYKEFIEKKADTHEIFQWTSSDNPSKDVHDIISDLKERYGEESALYQQEVLGKFVSFEGLVYHIQPENLVEEEPELKNFDYIFGSIDWGSTSVLLIGGIHKETKEIYILKELYLKEKIQHGHPSGDDFYSAVNEIYSEYGVDRIWADPEDKNAIKTFRLYGLPLIGATNAVMPGIREVTSKMPRIRIVEKNCKNLIYELQSYSWQESGIESFEYKKDMNPIKTHDHACDALRYFIMGINNIDKKLYQ